MHLVDINRVMLYTIYKTTNSLSGKIYIGTHKTENINDGYFGSGLHIKRALKKYGKRQFIKETLHIFQTPEEMFAKEKELVDETFVNRPDTYNKTVGGEKSEAVSSWTISRREKIALATKRQWANPIFCEKMHKVHNDPEFIRKATARLMLQNTKQWSDPTYCDKMRRHRETYRPTEETKRKMSAALVGRTASENTKNTMRDTGKKNRGQIWIKHIKTAQCCKVSPTDIETFEHNGWVRGRIYQRKHINGSI